MSVIFSVAEVLNQNICMLNSLQDRLTGGENISHVLFGEHMCSCVFSMLVSVCVCVCVLCVFFVSLRVCCSVDLTYPHLRYPVPSPSAVASSERICNNPLYTILLLPHLSSSLALFAISS